jgi:chemotaxis protein methyltransferase CheR
MSDALRRVAELVRAEAGIVIQSAQWPALAAAIGRVAPGRTPEDFLRELHDETGGSTGPALARLLDEVTVQETYFMREPRELQALDWAAVLEQAEASGSAVVRVWVAACATGEEAYTLGMLACEALGSPDPPVSILATDVSTAALERAKLARYSGRSLRNLPDDLRARHFVQEGSEATVSQGVRSLVRFRHHNLVRDPAPPPGEVRFDVIACRNVLIYFDGPTVERVIGSLESALRPDGTLILGVADRISGRGASVLRAGPPVERRAAVRSQARERASWRAGEAVPRRRAEDRIEDALAAANAGDVERALEIVRQLLERDPLNAEAYLVRGLAELGLGDARTAGASFRRALYVDPSFGLAAFQLGRAHDAMGDLKAARRAYEQALRTVRRGDERRRAGFEEVDLAEIAAACRERLAALAEQRVTLAAWPRPLNR